MLTCSVLLLALLASAQGRAVNISNTWVLPEEGFPVFYRYFRDRISWYEADAVCQFHHANLVTVDTTAQYDAVRAYLKELDISSAVWVGLIRSNPDGDFTWTDYRGLSSDGYWSSAPDAHAAPLCAAADPAADYRWEARSCGGPTVASFICELPVPQWALGNEGCMVRALPALTILYLPESASVQLTADCGLAGVRKVQCTGNVKRESLLKDLSCVDESETTTPANVATLSTSVPLITDTTFNYSDQETATDITTEETYITDHEKVSETTSAQHTTAAKKISIVQDMSQTNEQRIINKLNNIYGSKNMNLDLLYNNNLQRNDIPRIGLNENENFLTLEQSEKLEDERNMHHKMLHDELARHGNFETIFTQPTDHFVPPLVMAKARISDDMTVLSLAEKHAQQLAEHTFVKHNKGHEFNHYSHLESNGNVAKPMPEKPSEVEIIDKPLVITLQPIKEYNFKKQNKSKPGLPKKYKDKYDDTKSKVFKIDNKLMKFEKLQSETPSKNIEATAANISEQINSNENISMNLTVVLKEPDQNVSNTKYTGDVSNIETIQRQMPKSRAEIPSTETGTIKTETTTKNAPSSVTMTHEIIKITIVNENADKDSSTHTVFEVTTKMPEINNLSTTAASLTNAKLHDSKESNKNTNTALKNFETTITTTDKEMTKKSANELSTTLATKYVTEKKENIPVTIEQMQTTTEIPITTAVQKNVTSSIQKQNNSAATTATSTVTPVSSFDTTVRTKTDVPNATIIYTEELAENSTNSVENTNDLQSSLLTAANEPIHRPSRSRRPQLIQNRVNKFNLFRILG